MDTSKVEDAVSSIANHGMKGGAATSVFGWLTSNEGVAVIGVAVAVLGFIVNLYFKFRQDRREQVLQEAKISALLGAIAKKDQ